MLLLASQRGRMSSEVQPSPHVCHMIAVKVDIETEGNGGNGGNGSRDAVAIGDVQMLKKARGCVDKSHDGASKHHRRQVSFSLTCIFVIGQTLVAYELCHIKNIIIFNMLRASIPLS